MTTKHKRRRAGLVRAALDDEKLRAALDDETEGTMSLRAIAGLLARTSGLSRQKQELLDIDMSQLSDEQLRRLSEGESPVTVLERG